MLANWNSSTPLMDLFLRDRSRFASYSGSMISTRFSVSVFSVSVVVLTCCSVVLNCSSTATSTSSVLNSFITLSISVAVVSSI